MRLLVRVKLAIRVLVHAGVFIQLQCALRRCVHPCSYYLIYSVHIPYIYTSIYHLTNHPQTYTTTTTSTSTSTLSPSCPTGAVLLTDPSNCGFCGNLCASGICEHGTCNSVPCIPFTCSEGIQPCTLDDSCY